MKTITPEQNAEIQKIRSLIGEFRLTKDKDGALFAHSGIPEKHDESFWWDEEVPFMLPLARNSVLLPLVDWADDEPLDTEKLQEETMYKTIFQVTAELYVTDNLPHNKIHERSLYFRDLSDAENQVLRILTDKNKTVTADTLIDAEIWFFAEPRGEYVRFDNRSPREFTMLMSRLNLSGLSNAKVAFGETLYKVYITTIEVN